jgi:hypothetical protein
LGIVLGHQPVMAKEVRIGHRQWLGAIDVVEKMAQPFTDGIGRLLVPYFVGRVHYGWRTKDGGWKFFSYLTKELITFARH